MNRPYDPPNPWMDRNDMYRHMGRGPDTILRGRPLDLNWMGWRSNTAELQHHGWQFAESRSANHMHMGEDWRLEMRHPELGVSGMSVRNHRIHMRHQLIDRERGGPVHLTVHLGMPYMVVEREPMQMVAVDCIPAYQEIPRPSDLYYMPYFQPIGNAKDIFLQQATVEEIMQMALDKQAPHQAELRARRLEEQKRNEYRQTTGELKARLLMVA